MPGFVFFDTETTGLRAGWDQIVHFAAIRTDHDLKELDRFELRSRLSPGVVPHPMALLTNGIPIGQLSDRSLPSYYEMMCELVRRLEIWSPAIFVGYNSMRFDEEMLRHALFQCFHEPYLTSTPGNGRADALTLALAAHTAAPNVLKAPRDEDGRPRFHLGGIAAENGVTHRRAHDAISDVEAMLKVCRLVRTGVDEVWQRFQRFATKAAVSQFVETEDGFVLSEFFGGQAYHHPVALIGRPPENPNGRLCLDLTEDPDTYSAMSDEQLTSALCRKGTPIRRLAINAAPALCELWSAPDEFLNGLDLDTAEARARRVKDDPELCARLVAIYTGQWGEKEPSPHPEELLYVGKFPSDEDRMRRATFHDSAPNKRMEIVSRLQDPRLVHFGRQLIYSEHRGALPQEERLAADLALVERLLDAPDGPLTLPSALALIDTVLETESDPAGLLDDYRAWLTDRIAKTRAFRAMHAQQAG